MNCNKNIWNYARSPTSGDGERGHRTSRVGKIPESFARAGRREQIPSDCHGWAVGSIQQGIPCFTRLTGCRYRSPRTHPKIREAVCPRTPHNLASIARSLSPSDVRDICRTVVVEEREFHRGSRRRCVYPVDWSASVSCAVVMVGVWSFGLRSPHTFGHNLPKKKTPQPFFRRPEFIFRATVPA
jgi:hypothetical protein